MTERRPLALAACDYGQLANVIWITAHNARTNARAGRRDEALRNVYALLKLDPKTLPRPIVKLVQDTVKNVYGILDIPLPKLLKERVENE